MTSATINNISPGEKKIISSATGPSSTTAPSHASAVIPKIAINISPMLSATFLMIFMINTS